MLTTDQIILLAFLGFWMLLSIVTYVVLLRYTKKEYRKFYPHPIVNIVKDINDNGRFKFREKLFIFTWLDIIYLPIICEWFIAWCLYKFWKSIHVDATVEQKVAEETKEQSINTSKEEKIEQDKASLNAEQIEKALENSEYISKDEKSDDYLRSKEFLDYLDTKDNQDYTVGAYGIDLAQTSDPEINNVEAVKNTPTMDNEGKLKVEQEVKPKRKYNKKKKTENSDGNNEAENN